MTLRWYDYLALAFFAVMSVLCVSVSIPATFSVMRPFHDFGGAAGYNIAVAALIVFEVGAVGSKLTSLAVPQWYGRLTALMVGLLALTTAANYTHGYDLARAATVAPTLASVLHDPAGAVLATIAASALFPVLTFVFVSAFVHRCAALFGVRFAPVRLPSVRVLAVFEQRLQIGTDYFSIRDLAAALEMRPSTLHGVLKDYVKRQALPPGPVDDGA